MLKVLVFGLCLVPFAHLLWRAIDGNLGANPVETITDVTGQWGLRFLLITLAVTPLRRLFGWTLWLRFRRMLGLFAFFYAVLHVITYLVLEHFFDWHEIIKDITERPHITAGFVAFILMLPLTVTSTNNMMRRLGSRWKQLHRLVYVSATFAVLHFLLLVKADLREPFIYAVILLVLLGLRVYWERRDAAK